MAQIGSVLLSSIKRSAFGLMEKSGSVAMAQIGSVLLSSIKRSAFGLMLEGSLALGKMGITLLYTMKGAACNLMFKGYSLTEIGSALLFPRKRAALALVLISSLSDPLKIRCWKKNLSAQGPGQLFS